MNYVPTFGGVLAIILLVLRSELASLVSAIHVGSELFEIASHQLVEALVSGRVLNEARLIAETVETIIS